MCFRNAVAAVAVAVALLALGACGGDSDTSTTPAPLRFSGIPREKLKDCLNRAGLDPGDSDTSVETGDFKAQGILVTFPSATPVFLFATPSETAAESAQTVSKHPPPPKGWVIEHSGNVLVIYQAHPTAKEKAQINSCLPG